MKKIVSNIVKYIKTAFTKIKIASKKTYHFLKTYLTPVLIIIRYLLLLNYIFILLEYIKLALIFLVNKSINGLKVVYKPVKDFTLQNYQFVKKHSMRVYAKAKNLVMKFKPTYQKYIKKYVGPIIGLISSIVNFLFKVIKLIVFILIKVATLIYIIIRYIAMIIIDISRFIIKTDLRKVDLWVIIKGIHHFLKKHPESTWGYIFISSWLIGFLAFTLYPLAQSFYYSLNDADFKGDNIVLKYIDFTNFRNLFLNDTRFPTLLAEYVTEIIVNVPIAIVFALLISMLLNQKVKGRGLWRVIFFLPVVISSGPIINELTNQGASTVPMLNNPEVRALLMENLPDFLYQPILALFNKMIMVLWFTGIPILIFLAGLQKIDKSVYEAAAIDGASPWESFWKVTLPAVKQFIMVNIIYMFVTLSYNASFKGSEIINYIQEHSFWNITTGQGFGYGSAIAWIFFVVLVILISIFIGLLNIKRGFKR